MGAGKQRTRLGPSADKIAAVLRVTADYLVNPTETVMTSARDCKEQLGGNDETEADHGNFAFRNLCGPDESRKSVYMQ
jgi:hypothetical protein